MFRSKWLIGLTLAAVAVIALGVGYRSYAFESELVTRIRFNVTVERQGVEYSGAAVQEFTNYRGGVPPQFPGFGPPRPNAEAVVVEFPDGSAVAVLVEDHNATGSPFLPVLANCLGDSPDFEASWAALKTFEGPCELERMSLPFTVFIPDRDTFEGMVGIWRNEGYPISHGIRFVRAWVETTDEPLTNTISTVLPWVRRGAYPEPYLTIPSDDDGTRSIALPSFKKPLRMQSGDEAE